MLTRDDAIRIAREAGIDQVIQHAGGVLVIPDAVLERFAAAAHAAGAAAEREACAKACESTVWTATIPEWREMTKNDIASRSMTACAAAIRQRAAYRTLTPQELADIGRNVGETITPGQPTGRAADWLRVCRCGPDGCADSACPGRTA